MFHPIILFLQKIFIFNEIYIPPFCDISNNTISCSAIRFCPATNIQTTRLLNCLSRVCPIKNIDTKNDATKLDLFACRTTPSSEPFKHKLCIRTIFLLPKSYNYFFIMNIFELGKHQQQSQMKAE